MECPEDCEYCEDCEDHTDCMCDLHIDEEDEDEEEDEDTTVAEPTSWQCPYTCQMLEFDPRASFLQSAVRSIENFSGLMGAVYRRWTATIDYALSNMTVVVHKIRTALNIEIEPHDGPFALYYNEGQFVVQNLKLGSHEAPRTFSERKDAMALIYNKLKGP